MVGLICSVGMFNMWLWLCSPPLSPCLQKKLFYTPHNIQQTAQELQDPWVSAAVTMSSYLSTMDQSVNELLCHPSSHCSNYVVSIIRFHSEMLYCCMYEVKKDSSSMCEKVAPRSGVNCHLPNGHILVHHFQSGTRMSLCKDVPQN